VGSELYPFSVVGFAGKNHRMSHDSTQRSPESLEAFAAGDKDHLRSLTLSYIRGRGSLGATADESSISLGLLHNSVAPRFVELEDAGLIVKVFDENGQRVRRETRQGSLAGVYVAIECDSSHPISTSSAPESGAQTPMTAGPPMVSLIPPGGPRDDRLFPDDAPLRHRDLS
jgi:hypothetical protein